MDSFEAHVAQLIVEAFSGRERSGSPLPKSRTERKRSRWNPAGAGGFRSGRADVAQLVEHSLGKGEVISSILIIGSRKLRVALRCMRGCF